MGKPLCEPIERFWYCLSLPNDPFGDYCMKWNKKIEDNEEDAINLKSYEGMLYNFYLDNAISALLTKNNQSRSTSLWVALGTCLSTLSLCVVFTFTSIQQMLNNLPQKVVKWQICNFVEVRQLLLKKVFVYSDISL